VENNAEFLRKKVPITINDGLQRELSAELLDHVFVILLLSDHGRSHCLLVDEQPPPLHKLISYITGFEMVYKLKEFERQ
jgi:hypothetical protein